MALPNESMETTLAYSYNSSIMSDDCEGNMQGETVLHHEVLRTIVLWAFPPWGTTIVVLKCGLSFMSSKAAIPLATHTGPEK